LFFNGDIDRAIHAFETAAELNPKAVEPHQNLVNLYIQKGDMPNMVKAGDECQEVLKRKPGNKDIHLIYGNILRTEAGMETDQAAQKSKLEEAAKEVQQAEDLNAPEAMCENTISMIELQLGDIDNALKHVEHAIDKQPTFPDAHLI